MLNVDNKFDFGQIVYLKTDKEQLPRIVTSMILTKCEIIYEVYAGAVYSKHYDFEISETADILNTLT